MAIYTGSYIGTPVDFLKDMQKAKAFNSNSCMKYAKLTDVCPNLSFKDITGVSSYSKKKVYETAKKKMDKGYQIIARVSTKGTSTGNHYVYCYAVENNDIRILDSSFKKDYLSQYKVVQLLAFSYKKPTVYKQTNKAYKDILINPKDNNSTLGKIGCLVFSYYHMAIYTNAFKGTPQQFLNALTSVNAFTSNSTMKLAQINKICPKLKYKDTTDVTEYSKKKVNAAAEKKMSKGYKLIAKVSTKGTNTGNHYVYCYSVENGKIRILDSSFNKNYLSEYKVCALLAYSYYPNKAVTNGKNYKSTVTKAKDENDIIKEWFPEIEKEEEKKAEQSKTEQELYLKDGQTYKIRTYAENSVDGGLFIGTKGNATKSGTNVQLVKSSAASALWVAHYNSKNDAWYFTLKDNSKVALNLSADKIKSKTNANIYKFAKDDKTQEFKLIAHKPDKLQFYISSAANENIVLDAYGDGEHKVNGNIWSYTFTKGEKTQCWKFIEA
jgi:hypothetical protein